MVSWTVDDLVISSSRLALTNRVGRLATEQVGRWGRTVNEVAVELGFDWHTVNDFVIAYALCFRRAQPLERRRIAPVLVDDPNRVASPPPLGLGRDASGSLRSPRPLRSVQVRLPGAVSVAAPVGRYLP